jgi:hypothetical protein
MLGLVYPARSGSKWSAHSERLTLVTNNAAASAAADSQLQFAIGEGHPSKSGQPPSGFASVTKKYPPAAAGPALQG